MDIIELWALPVSVKLALIFTLLSFLCGAAYIILDTDKLKIPLMVSICCVVISLIIGVLTAPTITWR